MPIDIRQLRYFVTIVEEGSLSKASANLNVAQSALSFHLRNMENELGAQLLFRTARGVLPTDAGLVLSTYARLIIGHFVDAEQAIRGQVAEPSGEVRLGLPGTISQILSVPLIIAARERYPRIKLRIAEAMSGFINDWLHDHRVDLGVLYLPEMTRQFTSEAVLSEQLCLIGPRDGATDLNLPSGDCLVFKEIVALPLILPSLNHGLRELLQRRAAENHLTITTEIDVDSYGGIKELVEKGLGFSILPINAVDQEVRQGRLRMWWVSKPELTRDVHLVSPSDRPMPNTVSAIESLCRQTLLQLVVDGRWRGAVGIAHESHESCGH